MEAACDWIANYGCRSFKVSCYRFDKLCKEKKLGFTLVLCGGKCSETLFLLVGLEGAGSSTTFRQVFISAYL